MMPRYLLSEWLERVFAVVALTVTSGAFIPLIETGGQGIESVFTPWHFAALSAVYLGTGLLLLPRLGEVFALSRHHLGLGMFLLFLMVSCFWSVNPASSLFAALAAIATAMLGVYLVLRFTSRDILRLLVMTLFLLGLASVVFAYLLPMLGQQPYTGRWRGVFVNRNSLATYMALGLMIAFLQWSARQGSRPWLAFACLFFGWMLYKTGSRTSTIALFVVLGQCAAFWAMYRSGFSHATIIAVVLFVVAPLGGLFLQASWQDIVLSIGRNETFSGRTEAWNDVIALGMERPLLGYGNLSISDEVPPPHNMILALWLKGGFAGVALFLSVYLAGFVRAALTGRFLPPPDRYFHTALLTFLFVRGSMEGLYFSTLLWVLLVVSLLGPGIFLRRMPRYESPT